MQKQVSTYRYAIAQPVQRENVANYGKAVMMRGPLVYCLEQIDNPDTDIFSLVLSHNSDWKPAFEKELLNGMVTLAGDAWVRDDSTWDLKPYQQLPRAMDSPMKPVKIKAIPYYAWANRGCTSMITALPYS